MNEKGPVGAGVVGTDCDGDGVEPTFPLQLLDYILYFDSSIGNTQLVIGDDLIISWRLRVQERMLASD